VAGAVVRHQKLCQNDSWADGVRADLPAVSTV
jgi:hypothetical protein